MTGPVIACECAGPKAQTCRDKGISDTFLLQAEAADSKETTLAATMFQTPELLGILVPWGNQAGEATFKSHDGWNTDRSMS